MKTGLCMIIIFGAHILMLKMKKVDSFFVANLSKNTKMSKRGVIWQLSTEGLWTVEERGSGESEGSREEGGWELVEEGRGSASPWGAWFLKTKFLRSSVVRLWSYFHFFVWFWIWFNTTFTCCGVGSNFISCRQHVTRAWWLKHVVQRRINFQIRSLWVCLKEKVWENK